MRRKPTVNPESGSTLFTYLDGLICTMGALIVVLVVMVHHGKLEAQAARKAAQAGAGAADEAEIARQDLQWRIDQLRIARDKTLAQLDDQRQVLSHLEEHSRRLRTQLDEQESAREQLIKTAAGEEGEQGALKDQVAQTEEQAARLAAELEERLRSGGAGNHSYAIVPYHGHNQTRRRPIYIECRGDGVVFQPEGIVLTPQDFMGDLDNPNNPLSAGLRAAREQMILNRGATPDDDGVPYPLLLVRPDGIEAYYFAQAAMGSWSADFGYELIDQDWQIEYPPGKPATTMTVRQAVTAARQYQAYLVRSAPRLMGQGERMTFRPSSGGGLARSDGSGAGGGSYRGRYGSPGHRPAWVGNGYQGSDLVGLDDARPGARQDGGGDSSGGHSSSEPHDGGSSSNPYGDALASLSAGARNAERGARSGQGTAGRGDAGTRGRGDAGTAGGGGPPAAGIGGIGRYAGGGVKRGDAETRGRGDQGTYQPAAQARKDMTRGLEQDPGSGAAADGGLANAGGGRPQLLGGTGERGTGAGTNRVEGAAGPGPLGTGTSGRYADASAEPTNGESLPGVTRAPFNWQGGGNAAVTGYKGEPTGESETSGDLAASPGQENAARLAKSDNGPSTNANGQSASPRPSPVPPEQPLPDSPGPHARNGSAGGLASAGDVAGDEATSDSGVAGLAPANDAAGVQRGTSASRTGSRGSAKKGDAKGSGSSNGVSAGTATAMAASGLGGSTSQMGQTGMAGIPSPNINLGQPPDSLADQRGPNWANQRANDESAKEAVVPIRLICDADHLSLLPERGSGRDIRVIKLGGETTDSVDELVDAVWDQVDSWGTAGRGNYWRPKLVFEIERGGEQRFAELKSLLRGSGFDVVGRPRAAAKPKRRAPPAPRRGFLRMAEAPK